MKYTKYIYDTFGTILKYFPSSGGEDVLFTNSSTKQTMTSQLATTGTVENNKSEVSCHSRCVLRMFSQVSRGDAMHNDGGWSGRIGVLGLLMTFKMVEDEDGKKESWGKNR